MQRYELEGFVEEIKGTCATSLKVINNYMIRGDYCKYVVFDTIVETIDGRRITRKEPRVVELPCINLKEVERAANIVKKLSKVVETSVKSINPEKQEWKKKSSWQEWSEAHPEEVQEMENKSLEEILLSKGIEEFPNPETEPKTILCVNTEP